MLHIFAAILIPCAVAQETPARSECSAANFASPNYPDEAIRVRIQGVVTAFVLIGRDGKPEKAEYTGHSILTPGAKASTDATRLAQTCAGTTLKVIYRFVMEPIYLPDSGRRCPPVPPVRSVDFKEPNEFVVKYSYEPVDCNLN